MSDCCIEEAQSRGVLGSGLIGREAYPIRHRGKAGRTRAVCAHVCTCTLGKETVRNRGAGI